MPSASRASDASSKSLYIGNWLLGRVLPVGLLIGNNLEGREFNEALGSANDIGDPDILHFRDRDPRLVRSVGFQIYRKVLSVCNESSYLEALEGLGHCDMLWAAVQCEDTIVRRLRCNRNEALNSPFDAIRC